MRGTGGLQKLLYLIMLVLGIYILYKAGRILLESGAAQQTLGSGEVQRELEDAAMRTYASGYTAAVEGRGMPDWLAGWMRQVVPVYSYLAEGQAGETEETAQGETREGQAVVTPETQTERKDDSTPGERSGESSSGEPERSVDTNSDGGSDKYADESIGEGSDKYTDESIGGGSDKYADESIGGGSGMLSDESAGGEYGEYDQSDGTAAQPATSRTVVSEQLLAQLEDFDYLLAHYYTVDEGTMADAQLLDADVLLQKDLRLTQNPSVPQILIYHTHSQEAFADSREGETEDTIVGMGEVLAEELRSSYGYNVIHDTGVYDLVDGVLDRSAAYDYAREAIERILEEYPSIEVIIDLHRDGVEGEKFVTEIDGQSASRIMFFNGISRDNADQPLAWLENPYTQDNLAFSLQLQLVAEELYPGFTRNIYLKAERFNLHLRPRSLLIEAGTQLNTVEEERNAMRPIADLLYHVLGAP